MALLLSFFLNQFLQEGVLIKLQQHIEAEETKWQQQLAEKEAELTAVVRERDELRNGSSGDQSSVVSVCLFLT